MPAPLQQDAMDFLRSSGKPFDASSLNAAMDYLRNNPEARPSYASDYGGSSTMDQVAMGLGMSPAELGHPMSPTYNEAGYSNQAISRRNDAPGDLAPYPQRSTTASPTPSPGGITSPFSSPTADNAVPPMHPQGQQRTITIKEGPVQPKGVTNPRHGPPMPSPSRPTTAQPNVPSPDQPNASIPVTPPFGAPATSMTSPPDGSSGGSPTPGTPSILPDALASTYGVPDPSGDNSNLWMGLLPLAAGAAYGLMGRRPPGATPHIPPSGVGAARQAGALSGDIIPPGRSVVPGNVPPGVSHTLEGNMGYQGPMTDEAGFPMQDYLQLPAPSGLPQPSLSPTPALPGPRSGTDVMAAGRSTSVPPSVMPMQGPVGPSQMLPKTGSLMDGLTSTPAPAPKRATGPKRSAASSKSAPPKSSKNKAPSRKRQAGKSKTQKK